MGLTMGFISNSLISGICCVVLCGAAFGIVFPILLRKRLGKFTDKIFNADTKYILSEPEGFQYRMPCSYMKTDKFAIGSVLYLGKSGFSYVPHKKNLKRHQNSFDISPLESCQFSLAEPSYGKLTLILTPKPPLHLEIKTGNNAWKFLVPTPQTTLRKIQECCNKLVTEETSG